VAKGHCKRESRQDLLMTELLNLPAPTEVTPLEPPEQTGESSSGKIFRNIRRAFRASSRVKTKLKMSFQKRKKHDDEFDEDEYDEQCMCLTRFTCRKQLRFHLCVALLLISHNYHKSHCHKFKNDFFFLCCLLCLYYAPAASHSTKSSRRLASKRSATSMTHQISDGSVESQAEVRFFILLNFIPFKCQCAPNQVQK
jgi:hypothetical protein